MDLSNKLAEMQVIDDKISNFLKESAHLPEQLKDLQDNVEQDQQSLQSVVDELKECKENQSKLELDVQSNNQLIQKYQQQLSGITNNKEYKALNSEIALLKSKNNNLDEQELKLMEQEKVLSEQKSDAEEKLAKSESDLLSKESKINEQIEQVKSQIEERKAERNAIAKELPLSLVKQYVLLIKKKNRKAVAFALKDACSECGFRLRPQLLLELESGCEPKVCENCGRFLVGLSKEEE